MKRPRYLRPAWEMPEIYLYRAPVDFRKQANGLALLVEQELGHNPFSGALYAFTNRQQNKIKCLMWEDNGFVLYYKALAEVTRVMKGSLTRQAMEYTLNQWDFLVGYCARGDLHISNVLAENAIRPFAVGRRAWLFADTSRGAHASATCYSLIETAKANGLEPAAYIHHVLEHIATADTLEALETLLPWNVNLAPVEKK